MPPMDTAREIAITTIRNRGGIIRTHEAFSQGIHRRTLYGLRDEGALVSLSRGVYQLAEMDNIPTEIDLVNVAKVAPHGVICLISALSFHSLTTQIPHEVWLAVERKARKPKITYPPVRTIFFTGRFSDPEVFEDSSVCRAGSLKSLPHAVDSGEKHNVYLRTLFPQDPHQKAPSETPRL